MDEVALRLKVIDLDRKVAVLESQLQCSAEARTLQAKEYERRLQDLNHAHEQQVVRDAKNVSRETYDIFVLNMDKWRREVDMWRWIAIGIGIAGGGTLGGLIHLIK